MTNEVFKIDRGGNVVQTWTLTAAGTPQGIAVSPDETVLYYTTLSDPGAPLHRHDLVTDLPLSAFPAPATPNAGAGFVLIAIRNLLALMDGSILWAGHEIQPDFSAPQEPLLVYRFSPAGALLNTYDFDTVGWSYVPGFRGDNQIYHGTDDPNTFRVWVRVFVFEGPVPIRHLRHAEVRVSDGVILSEIDTSWFEAGMAFSVFGGGGYTLFENFGTSESCPALTLPVGEPIIGPLIWVHWPKQVIS